MYTQNGQTGAVGVIRSIAVSVLFLVGAIGYSVSVLFKLLSSIAGGVATSNFMSGIMSLSGNSGDLSYSNIQMISSMFGGMTIFTAVVSMVPTFVILAGIWLVFAAAKRNILPGTAAAGLTMIRVIVIIQLVFVCVGSVLLEIGCFIVMAGVSSVAGYHSAGGSMMVVLIVSMIVLAAVAAVQIIYYLKLSGTIKTIKETLITGQPDDGISLYAEIFCYIGSAGSAISAFISLAGMSMYGFLSNVGMATAVICFAILLRQYRGKMSMMIQNPQQMYQTYQPQTAGQQGYQAQPQTAGQQGYQAQPQAAGQQGYQAQPQTAGQQPSGAAYGETDVLPYYNETTVLGGQMVNNGVFQSVRLTRQKTGETICINKPAFWFGKEAGNVDYCITDNTAISRRHAVIIIRNNECYIQDNHSTNRVFLNGHMLEAGVDTPVANGDRVRMGDEEFTVSIG